MSDWDEAPRLCFLSICMYVCMYVCSVWMDEYLFCFVLYCIVLLCITTPLDG